MQSTDKTTSPSFIIKALQWIIVLLTVYTLAGFLIVSPVIKSILTKELSALLNREVSIASTNFNPYVLSLYVNNFTVQKRDKSGPLFSFTGFSTNVQAASLKEKGLILKEARLYQPYINIVRNDDGSYSVSDLLEGGNKKPASESPPLRFSVNNIEVVKGNIDFFDGPKKTRHTVRDITVRIPMISNLPYNIDTYVQPLFRADINKTPVSIQGKTKPFHDSLQTDIDLDIKAVNIPHYLEYVPLQMNFKVLTGMIDSKARISFRQYNEKENTLTLSGDISLHDLDVVDNDGNPMVNIPLYSLEKVVVDFSNQKLTIGEMNSEKGTIVVRRNKDGALNMERPLPKVAKELEQAAKEKKEEPWDVLINNVVHDDYAIQFEDRAPAVPVSLTAGKIKLRAENISLSRDSRASLSYSFDFNKKGTVSAKSSFGINPIAGDMDLSIENLNITPLQPYISENLNIMVTDGNISADGKISYDTEKDGELSMNFKGKVSLTNFVSIDKASAEDFLKWNSLFVNGIDYATNPAFLNIQEIALSDFYSRLIVNSDGTLNVQKIKKEKDGETPALTEPPDEPADTEEGGQKAKVIINAVTLQGGTVNFSDKQIKPGYSASLLEIGGRISGLSSEEGSRADVDLKGKLESSALLEITGAINPLGDELFVDLKIDFNNMDLSPLTPYAHKYVGHTIQKGKLDLDLKYLIDKKKLQSQNNVFLDQFTFGKRVESPDATKLPVKLAVALLKNRKGEITLDLPVSGKTDDPEFSIGSVIIKLLLNILVKAATSPFALLGAIVGGGEELSYIEFDYASAFIREQEQDKLNKLVTALSDRPSLKIDIEGYVDLENDKEGLRQYLFRKKLKAQKLKATALQKGHSTVPVDEIKIEPEEYEKYLIMAYEEDTFPKPKNSSGTDKKLPAGEMEKLMLTHIVVSDDDLRKLASERATEVTGFFLKSGKIDPKRVFLIEPESLSPEKKDNLKNSRVDFRLK